MPLVRLILIFMMGLLYGIFTKGTSVDEYSISHIIGVCIGFMITSFIFAAIVYLISMIFVVSTTSETEQREDIILDEEYATATKPESTNFERFTKYWIIVGIVTFVLMTLNSVIQPS